MIKSILCGMQQVNLLNKREKQVAVRPVEKRSFYSHDPSSKSLVKEKRSLKCITNKQNSPKVHSHFRKQAEETDTQKNPKRVEEFQQSRLESINQQREKEKPKPNSFFSRKQNKKKFQTIIYFAPQTIKNNKSTVSQHVLHHYQSAQPKVSFGYVTKVSKCPQEVLQVNAQSKYYNERRLKRVESLYIIRQNQVNSKTSFSNAHFFRKDQKKKHSLRPHSSVENNNLKTTQFQAPKDKKPDELGKQIEKHLTFSKSRADDFHSNKTTQIFENINNQKAEIQQKNPETSKFFLKARKHECAVSQYQRQRISLGSNINKNETENQKKIEHHDHPMSKFFPIKTSNFFVQTGRIDKGLGSSTFKEVSQFHDGNCEKNIQKSAIIDKKQNLTDSTRASSFFELKHWKKRELQSRFSGNESTVRTNFGLTNQHKQVKFQESNIFVPKLKTQLSEGKFIQIPLKQQNDERHISPKRKTFNQYPSIQNLTQKHNLSLKSSFFFNPKNRKIQDDEKNNSILSNKSATTETTQKFERSQKPKPSFFLELQRKRQEHKALKIKQEKTILQKEEQENNQVDLTGGLFSAIEFRDAQSVVDEEFSNSQRASEVEFVLHPSDKIKLKSLTYLKTLQGKKKNFAKLK